MKTEEYNKAVSFRVPGVTYGYLCRAISQVPGVAFLQRRRFFWSGVNVGAEFSFRGNIFKIETDPWDGALWILAKDKLKHEVEMQELRDAVERFTSRGSSVLGFLRRVISETFT